MLARGIGFVVTFCFRLGRTGVTNRGIPILAPLRALAGICEPSFLLFPPPALSQIQTRRNVEDVTKQFGSRSRNEEMVRNGPRTFQLYARQRHVEEKQIRKGRGPRGPGRQYVLLEGQKEGRTLPEG
jgi:hypothetical protein